MTYLSQIQTEKAGLLQQRALLDARISQIDGIERVCVQFAPGALFQAGDSITLPNVGPAQITGPTPQTNINQPSTASATDTAGRKSASVVAVEALRASPGGMTVADAMAWIQRNYSQFKYQKNHVSLALIREWQGGRSAAVGPVGKEQNPKYYPLGVPLPQEAHMASPPANKTTGQQPQAATG
jgi:hypothetical protein